MVGTGVSPRAADLPLKPAAACEAWPTPPLCKPAHTRMEQEREEDVYLPKLKVSSTINILMPCPFSSAFVLHRPAAMGQHTLCNGFFLF